mgnify:FL=1
MQSTITTSANFNSNTIQSNANMIDAEFYSERQTSTSLDLYQKYEDEPDFDCEFLNGISYNEETENTIDAETDEDFADLYNDNQWDVDIYDPYLESTYF